MIILMPNVRFQSRESLFWGKIIDGVAAVLAEREVGVMMVTESYSERALKSVNPEGVLGLIGIGYIATPLLLEIRHAGSASASRWRKWDLRRRRRGKTRSCEWMTTLI